MVRVALYGVAHWHAGLHLDAFARAGAQIIAVGDPDPARREGFAHDANYPRYGTIESLIDEQRPDFVMVMGKPAAMLADAERLIDARIPFGIEKPLGRSAAEGAVLANRAAAIGLFATVPLVNRYSRLWDRLWDPTSSAPHPEPVHAQFKIINGHPGRYRRDGVGWVLEPTDHGGGAMRNLGIHAADAFLHLCRGDTYTVLGAAIHGAGHAEAVESHGVALVRSTGGILATIEAGYSYPTWAAGGDFEWRVATRDAYFLDRSETLSVSIMGQGSPSVEANVSQEERYAAFAADVVDRLTTGRPPRISLSDTVRAMALIDRIYAAAQEAER